MTNIINFNFDNKEVRTLLINEKPYFVGCDVAEVLGYAKPNNAISTHCKGALKQGILTEGGKQEMLVIPEGDVFRLIIKSRLEKAQKFESLVMDEILPSLRKTGKYEINPTCKENLQVQTPVIRENRTTQSPQLTQLNTIDLTDFTSWQYFYMNDPMLYLPYFRFKINKETNLPVINRSDWHLLISNSLGNVSEETITFCDCYGWTGSYKGEPYTTAIYYLEQFRQSFKKAADLKLLQELNHDIQLIETEEDYNKTTAIQNYMQLIGNEPLLTATEVGARLGISALKVGKIANQLNLKCEKYGQWFKDKAQYSIKEVQTFRYNQNIIQALKEYLGIDDVKLISNS